MNRTTIAREYGPPALANVKHATKRLRTGERVKLDAVRGLVHRLDHPGRAEGRQLKDDVERPRVGHARRLRAVDGERTSTGLVRSCAALDLPSRGAGR